MSAKLLVLLACVALIAGGVVKREADDSPEFDWGQHAHDFVQFFKDCYEMLTNSETSLAVQGTAKDGTATALAQMSRLAQAVQTGMVDASGKTKETMEQVYASLAQSASDLREAYPPAQQRASDLTTQLKDKLQAAELDEKLLAAGTSTLQGSKTLATGIGSQTIEVKDTLVPQLKAAYEAIVRYAQEVLQNIGAPEAEA